MKNKIKLLSIKPLKSGHKKYVAEFEIITKDGKKKKKNTKFGAKGMSDYTIHKDTERRNRYIKRHTKDLRTNDPTRAGFLSMYVLWNKKSYKSSLSDYKRRLNAYNRTGKFQKSIQGSSLKSKFGKYTNSAVIKNVHKYLDFYNFNNNNSFGRVYLYPFLVDKTRFRNLPHDIIKRIEQELQLSDIINQYKSYRDKKQVFKLITGELGERQTDNPYEYIFDWDPSDEQSVEWLEEASKLLTKSDLNNNYWKSNVAKFILGFEEVHNLYAPGQNSNYDMSEKYMKILLNKIGFQPALMEDNMHFLDRQDVLDYFQVLENNFGKVEKSKVPDNVKNPKLYLKIKAKIKQDVKKKNRRWGAYDSGRLVREYKQSGGKYSGTKKSKTSSKKSSNLDRWYREKWIDACAWPKRKSCGRTKAFIKSKVSYCRPSKVIDSNTPKTVQELTKAQIKKRCAKKSKNPKKIVRK
uniref:DUF5872 domain-containing protein n=1 Tax=viral metagenome TaxID=1070528 RepID=A0A6C0LHW3_9ZZZZ